MSAQDKFDVVGTATSAIEYKLGTLPERLKAFKADYKAGKPPFNAPPHIHPIMERATEELIASGLVRNSVKEGNLAPNFQLQDQDGNQVSSIELLSQGPLIVSFYRGAWCPYCNIEIQAMNEFLPTIHSLGAKLVAISPMTPANGRRAVRKHELNFPVLSDPGNEVAAQYGLKFELPNYLIDLYKSLRNELPAVNGDPSWTLPMPARFVVGQDGYILYSEVNPDYTHRPDPSEMLPILKKLAGS
ncbi:peroxiredoxin-like family protein [Paraburkholderia largidicola]|uniref:thioredoxin-dependent peroxiredoxin n=1 Tax=Paraburkholderia largidicola TaxID=3014751 RepID=A0A7I8C1U4_9BURK|nr:peroxiredoxin-like family protein [Paraburkholderia sp. PGU16]BCF95037.1 peroxiredoxin [Paraburkholderia sp. PGU16]